MNRIKLKFYLSSIIVGRYLIKSLPSNIVLYSPHFIHHFIHHYINIANKLFGETPSPSNIIILIFILDMEMVVPLTNYSLKFSF